MREGGASWEENGGYSWDGPEALRETSVREWDRWLELRVERPQDGTGP